MSALYAHELSGGRASSRAAHGHIIAGTKARGDARPPGICLVFAVSSGVELVLFGGAV